MSTQAIPVLEVPPPMEALAVDPSGDEAPGKPRGRHHLGALAASILWSAVVDYRSTDRPRHLDAKRFLYPTEQAYREHLEMICLLADYWPMARLRQNLDRLRPIWNAERKRVN
jgi:hypothetical protein